MNYTTCGQSFRLGWGLGGDLGRRVPAQPPPHAEPTRPTGFASPASSALLPAGAPGGMGGSTGGHRTPSIALRYPGESRGARRLSGNGFHLVLAEKLRSIRDVDGICCRLSPRAERGRAAPELLTHQK